MIAVIASENGGAPDSLLAENLAVARRAMGQRVLLVDAAADGRCRAWARARAASHLRPLPEVLALRGMGFGERLARLQEYESGRHQDVLVGAGGCDSPECRSALAAARVAIVPIAACDADPAAHYRLIARLNAARMFNPGLRVLFAAVGDAAGAVAPADLARVRAYARQVMGGQVALTALPASALCASAAPDGACTCDADADAAGALQALCEEAFGNGRGPRRDAHCGKPQTVQG